MEVFIILIIILYLAFHAGHAHANYRHLRRRYSGQKIRLYWSSALGPYMSVRLPGGFRLGHRL